MNDASELKSRMVAESRRRFFGQSLWGLGATALAALWPTRFLARAGTTPMVSSPSHNGQPHFAPQAKRVIYLFMSGAPSQIDLFDYKPKMAEYFDQDLPESIRMGQRLTTMTSGQNRFPIAPSIYSFKQYGRAGAWISELLPHMASIADELAIVKSVHTEAINHDPAITFIQTGSQLPGKPSLGAWLSYGLGSENQNLPTYVVLNSRWSAKRDAQALFSRLWGAGFLPSRHQGVRLRSSGDPVLLSNPPGVNRETRRIMLDGLQSMNQQWLAINQDPEIEARMAQYELAFRMQASVPELTDLSRESENIYQLYGDDAREPGTFAANCLLARRLAERGVRCIQIFHRGWDQHGDLPRDLPLQCQDVDQGAAALVKDLKQRGMLDDTLVIWGGEFGRTIYCQGALSRENYGRDHHPRCFTMWMAGGGIKGGVAHGETDEFSYNVVRDPVHIRDLNATILHCMGLDPNRLTFAFSGLDQRLVGVDAPAHVVKPILA